MIDLARRSGQIISLTARTVHQADRFSYRYGLDETIEHIPAEGERGPITHVYAVAKLKDGGVQFEVMSVADVNRVRDASQGYKSALQYEKTDSPWMQHYDEMAKKTAIRRLFKYLPVSIEIQRAVTLDEHGEAGISQQNSAVIDGSFTEIPEQEQISADRTDPPADTSEPVTFAQVADAIAKLDTAAGGAGVKALIAQVASEQHQTELSDLLAERLDALRTVT